MTDQPPTIAEIAALTARLRALSNAGQAADQADVDRFLADKRELLDRITDEPADDRLPMPPMPDWMREQAEQAAAAYAAGALPEGPVDDPARLAARIAELRAAAGSDDTGREMHEHTAVRNHPAGSGPVLNDPWSDAAWVEDAARNQDDVGAGDPWADYRVYTPDEAAAALVAHGVPPDQAPGVVDRYLDSLTWDGWTSTDQWDIDDDDLDIMLSRAPGDEQADGAADDPARNAMITAASWAIAARDAAIDRGDTAASARFAAEAAEAIAAAQRAGVALNELAAELDYPGGVDAMLDGDAVAEDGRESVYRGPSDEALDQMHDSVQAARADGRFWQPAAAREQWRQRDEPDPDGRRWELRDVTDEPVDVADAYGSTYGTGYQWTDREFDPTRAEGLAHPGGPTIVSGPVLTAEAAAHALAQDGRDLDQARAQVAGYLDDLSATLDTPMHAWGLDDADLDALRAEPPPDTAGAASVHIPQPRAGEDEQDRRDQLNRWHHTDSDADTRAEVAEDGVHDVIDATATSGSAEEVTS